MTHHAKITWRRSTAGFNLRQNSPNFSLLIMRKTSTAGHTPPPPSPQWPVLSLLHQDHLNSNTRSSFHLVGLVGRTTIAASFGMQSPFQNFSVPWSSYVILWAMSPALDLLISDLSRRETPSVAIHCPLGDFEPSYQVHCEPYLSRVISKPLQGRT